MAHKRKKAAANRHRLNDPYIRRLLPGTEMFLVWDTVQAGLAVAVMPSGTKSFKVVYRHNGRLRWFHIDKFGAIGLADARSVASKIRAQVTLGKDPQGEKIEARQIEARKQGDTLAAVAKEYVERYTKLNNRSWRQAADLMDHHVLPRLGRHQIQEIARRDLRRLFDRITANGSPIMANQVLAAVSAVLSWAVEREIIEANVARGIKRNKTNAGKRFLDDAEIKAVWGAFEDLGLYPCYSLRVILLTAQRPGEVCAMRWHDVDLEKRVWTLLGEPDQGWPGTKNGKTHEVPLSSQAITLLQQLDPGDVGPVFPNGRGSRINIPHMSSVWQGLAIPRFRPHDLRATAASGMDALGVRKEHISRVLNHKEGGITASYIRHDHMDQKRRALEAWGAHVEAVLEGREADDKVVQFGPTA